MRKQIKILILIILCILGKTCTNEVSSPVPPTASRQPPLTVESMPLESPMTIEVLPTLSETLSPTMPIVSFDDIQQVTTSEVNPDSFWWEDSKTLYYSIARSKEWWCYNVETRMVSRLESTPMRPGTPSSETLSQIPSGAVSIVVSPSGEKGLYVVRTIPLPTPKLDIDGEIKWVNTPSELWLIENGTHQRIGPIEDCIENYLWSNDEKHVIARSWKLIPCQAYAWLVDLEKMQVSVLIPREEEWVEVIDLSPAGKKILARSRENGRLYIVDVTTGKTEDINVTQWAWGRWLDEENLIVGEHRIRQGARWTYDTFSNYDLRLHKRSQMLSVDDLPDLTIREFAYMTISPDYSTLAFISGQNLVDSLGEGMLWIYILR